MRCVMFIRVALYNDIQHEGKRVHSTARHRNSIGFRSQASCLHT